MVKIIAEAGVNHNGSLDMALELVDAAANAGADFVKFQCFKPELLATANAKKAKYQTDNMKSQESQNAISDDTESQIAMLKPLALDEKQFTEIAKYTEAKNIDFMCTAFDPESLKMVAGIGVKYLKIPSGEITNGPFLLAHAQTNLPIIISTGMANLQEIREALAVLAFGYKHNGKIPESLEECLSEYDIEALKGKVTILHCTSSYPAPFESLNLRAINLLKEEFGLDVGYSDHSAGILASVLSVACGAQIIEKHITLDKNLPGPDHKASIEPDELKELVIQAKEAEVALGKAEKSCTDVEKEVREIARRGVYAKKQIKKGEILSEDNIIALRPEADKSPMQLWQLYGSESNKDYGEGEEI